MAAAVLSSAPAASSLAQRQETRIERAVRVERKEGALLSFRLRLIVMALVACYLLTYGIQWRQSLNLAGLAALCFGAWVQYRIAGTRWDRPAIIAAFPVIDILIVVGVYFVATELEGIPRLVMDEDRGISWFLLLLTLQALSYRPWLAAWAGAVTAAAWMALFAWIRGYPGTFSEIPEMSPDAGHVDDLLRVYYDPLFIHGEAWLREMLVALLCGGVLAVAVQRSQGLLSRALKAERSRANLARYFSPSMVDELSAHDQPFDKPQETEIGVLFADIVGFTRIAELSTPAEVIAMLRDFHGRVARVIFDHDGTLDKFIGDSVMATFGTPVRGRNDPTRTIACCRAIVREVESWNGERSARGAPPVRIGIGAHFGRVVVGDIGDERRLEFAVIGDTVNVASRLEALTRSLGATILVSDDLFSAARREGAAAGQMIAEFGRVEPQHLRNREEAVAVWAYPPL